jgi:hypothetical protein
VFAASKVGVYLTRKERIFGDICISRVLIKREKEEPCYANYDEAGGEVRWDF